MFPPLNLDSLKNKSCQRGRNLIKPTFMPNSLTFDDPSLAWDSPAPGHVWDGFAPNPIPNAMAIDNRISVEITVAQKQAIVDAVTALKAALQPFLINLTVEERSTLPKISDRTLAFHEKCVAYRADRPDLTPSFVDVAEMAKDLKLIADLQPCLTALAPLCEGLEDTISLAFTDAYLADLSFYANVRQAAKRGVAGADTIYNDLKQRFPGRPPGPATPPPANG